MLRDCAFCRQTHLLHAPVKAAAKSEALQASWQRKLDMYVHILNSPDDDPIKQTTMDFNTLTSWNSSKKRPGRPKRNWTVEAAKMFWTKNQNALPQHLKGHDLDLTKDEHRQAIQSAAQRVQIDHTTKQTAHTYQPARERQGGGNFSRRLNPFEQIPFVRTLT